MKSALSIFAVSVVTLMAQTSFAVAKNLQCVNAAHSAITCSMTERC
ncbi:MAG: hypothetical protein H7256_15685 [Bdellovibrio sp.]|nr:hypothetical protein [Bdellovibrio sp.]